MAIAKESLQLPQHEPLAAPTLAPPTPVQVSPAKILLGVVMVVLGSVVTTLDLNLTNPSFNQQIQGSLGFTPDEATWITTAYTSANLLIIALAPMLTQVFSRRRYLVGSMALFVCVSLGCAAAWDFSSMLTFRTLQGLVAGTFAYSSFNIVLTQLPRAKQHIGFVLVAITTGLPVPIGNFVAGWIDENLSWQVIYFVNVFLGLLVILGLRHFIDPQPMQLSKLKQVDWLGSVVLAVSIICLVTVLERGNTENWFDSEFIVLLSLISVLFLAAFCLIELNQQNPLIDLRLFRQPNFAFANIFNLTYGIVLSYSFILPQYLAQIQSYNPVQVSSVLIWASLVNPTSAKIIEHVETRLVMGIGVSLFIVSCFMTSVLDQDVAGYQLVWAQIIRALGQPLMGSVVSYAATENIKKEQVDDASAIYNLVRAIATTTANASLGTLLTKREQFHSSILVDSVSMSNLPTQERIQQLSSFFTGKLGDSVASQSQAMKVIQQTVSKQAYLLAFSDCFYVIGIAVILGAIFSIPFLKVKKPADVIKATKIT